MTNKKLIILFVCFFNSIIFAQSAETGNAFNRYMSPESGINPLSGTVSFSVPLTSISAGDASVDFSLSYSGNVQKNVQSRNDLSPTGWVGLGWSLGNGKIVSDNKNTMTLDDDEFNFVTAQGVSYRLYKEEDANGNLKKWWIDGLPYWKVEQNIEVQEIEEKKFRVVVGWTLTDDNGKKYEYGDMSYCKKNEGDTACSEQSATEYELAWASMGYTGEAIAGSDSPYPKAWNLSKITDLYGETLKFYYTQYLEGLSRTYKKMDSFFSPIVIKSWNSKNKYTKECYLTKVESSKGSSVEFVLEDKGVGDYNGEIVDAKGKKEILETDENDVFIDPLERKFLSKIRIYGMDRDANGKKILHGTIEFCYSPLIPKITEKNVDENRKYTKRLLKNIVWMNRNGIETKREKYEYNDNVNAAYQNNKYPLGLMKKIEGSDCGSVEFEYDHIAYTSEKGMHMEKVPLVGTNIGYLGNGTPYLVGLDKKNKKVGIYYWVNGRWSISRDLPNLTYHEGGYFIPGDKDFFIYVTSESDSYEMIPVKWNGAIWVAEKGVKDDGDKAFVTAGPNYIVKAQLSEKKDQLCMSVPWTEWGATYNDFDCSHAETGKIDNKFLKVVATRNHFAVIYTGPDWGNNGRLRIYSFKHYYDASKKKDVSEIKETMFKRDLDDDQMYYWGNGYLFGAVESGSLWGQGAVAYHWNGKDGWTNEMAYGLDGARRSVDGVQGVPRAMATGYNYVALRHNDNDDMTIFDWDGDSWSSPDGYNGINMVHHDDLDLLVESEWDAISGGNDFFVARRPRIGNKIEIPVLCWPKPYWIGVTLKCIWVEVWSSTFPEAKIQYYQRVDGRWRNGDEVNTTSTDVQKKVLAGSNWYLEKESNKAFVWNKNNWKEEPINVDWSYLKTDTTYDGQTMHVYQYYAQKTANVVGDFFVVEGEPGKNEDGVSTIYYKKDDSFKKNNGIFVVSKKSLIDNVEDKTTPYSYKYHFDDKVNVGYDYINNTPIISEFVVTMPEGSSEITKSLCKVDTASIGLAQGQICEEKIIENGSLAKSVAYKYHRHRGASWPQYIYTDKLDSVITYIKGSKTIAETKYNIELNGLPSIERVYENDKSASSSEKFIVYAAEKWNYPFMKSANRLQEPVMSYSCKPNCSALGTVAEARAIRYSASTSENPVPHIFDEWTLRSDKKIASTALNSFNWDIKQNNTSIWQKKSEISKYNGRLSVEMKNQYGQKTSFVYDNDAISSLRATIENAGLDEVLIVPGDTCVELGMNISRCKIDAPLSGNMVLGVSSENGRFANKAIDLRTPFEGTVEKTRKGKYKFSAWVQNVDNTSATVSLKDGNSGTNLPLKSYYKDDNTWRNGAWKYIEWIGDVAQNGQLKVVLSASGHVRAQDIRMAPSKANINVKYYDKHFNTPVVEVNDRGIAKYFTLDENGRMVDLYGEDTNGNLVLVSRNKYVTGACRASIIGPDVLDYLEINSAQIDLPDDPSERIYFKTTADVKKLAVKWQTPNVYDSVRYRLYPIDVDTASWHRNCCSELDGVTASIEGADSWILELDVDPFDSLKTYKIQIEKSKVGWLPFGNSLQKGNKPMFLQHSDSSSIAFITKVGVYAADFTGNAWVEKLVGNADVTSLVSLKNSGQYLFGIPGAVIPNVNNNAMAFSKGMSSWSLEGSVLDASLVSKNFSATKDSQGNPCIAYESKKGNSSGDYSLSVSCYKNSTWNLVGGTVQYDKSVKSSMSSSGSCVMLDADFHDVEPTVIPNLVTESSVSAHDLALGPGKKLYIAYVGALPYTDMVMDNIINFLPDHSGIPDTNYSVSVPKVLMIKRLFAKSESGLSSNSDIWAGPSLIRDSKANKDLPNYMGDVVVIDSAEPISFVHDVKLAGNDSCLYMAVVHDVFLNGNSVDSFEGGTKRAVSVYKAKFVKSYNENGQLETNLVFNPYEDASVLSPIYAGTAKKESRIVAYLEKDSPFDFMVKDDVPYLSFANEQNGNALTVLKYDKNKSRWLSVGRPAFTYSSMSKEAASIAVGAKGTPVVVIEASSDLTEASERGRVTPLKYVSAYANEKDADLTLSSIKVNNVSSSIQSEFRQYILKYSARVDSSVSTISLTPTLMNSNDVVGIRLMKNGKEILLKKLKTSSSQYWAGINKQKIETSLKMDVPLDEGDNEIIIEVCGINGLHLSYTIDIFREILQNKCDADGDDNRGICDYDLTSDDDLNQITSGDTSIYTIGSDNDSAQICIHLPFGLGVIYRGRYIHRNTCLDIHFPGGGPDTLKFVNDEGEPGDTSIAIIVPSNPNKRYSSSEEYFYNSSSSVPPYMSSSSVPPYMSSSSGEMCIPFENGEGHYGEKCFNSGLMNMEKDKCYTMNPDRANENPIWINNDASQTWWWIKTSCRKEGFSSSSVFPYMSSSGVFPYMSSSSVPPYMSSSSVPPYMSSSSVPPYMSSSSVPPYMSSSSVPPYMSSSSVPPYMSSSSVPSSSSVNDLGDGGAKDGEGNIPVIYSSLLPYKLLATETLMLADRVNVSGRDFRGAFVEVGANASVSGRIVSGGNVSLRSYSKSGAILLAGSLDAQQGAVHESVTVANVPAVNLYTIDFVTGPSDVIVNKGQTKTITPGLYKDLRAYEGSRIYLEGGDYYFESFSIEPNSYLYFKKPIRLWVKNRLYIADRVNAVSEGIAEELFIYTNSSNDMYLGVTSALKAFLVAPNSSVNLAPGSNWTGYIWAKNVNVQADVVVK